MDSVHDLVPQLSMGSLVDCKFDSGKVYTLQVAGLYNMDDKKIHVSIPDGITCDIVECRATGIFHSLLMEHGFEFTETELIKEYKISLRKSLQLVLRQGLKNEVGVFSVFLYDKSDQKDDQLPSIIALGRIRYFYKIQDLYRTFTSKNLSWKR